MINMTRCEMTIETVCSVIWLSNHEDEKSTTAMPATLPDESKTGL